MIINMAGLILSGYQYLMFAFYGLIAIAGVAGIVSALIMRPDAFAAGGRQSKVAWLAILVGSSLVVLTQVPFLSWFGMVAIGVYWFDVYPNLRDIVRGNGSW